MTNITLPIYYHPKQAQIFESKAKKKIIPKGRRFGLTKGYANDCIESMLDGVSPILWVDTVYPNITRYIERYFFPILSKLPKSTWQWREQKKELQVLDSVCDLRSADRPELIEGFAYKKIYLNEAGIILKKRYLWENTILPMIMDFDPMVYVGGTPKGQGLFFELYMKAKDPLNKDWEHFDFTSYDNPYLDKETIDTLANDMPDLVRRQEIYAEFLEDKSLVFRNFENCMGSIIKEPEFQKRYYAGFDVAKHVDYSVLIIIDEDGSMVYFNRFQKDYPYQKKLVAEVVRKYNNATLLIDASGVGDPIYDDFVEMDLNVEPYKFTNLSKKQLIECLMLAFELEKIKILNEPILIDEIKIFSYEISSSGLIKYSAPEGYHDDCVISLALANWCYDKFTIGQMAHTLDYDVY